jgi:DNA-binding transcriptional MocR family regulator
LVCAKATDFCHLAGETNRIASTTAICANTASASKHGCTFAAEPAGLFGWVDTGVDTEQLAARMLDDGILLAPGSLFNATRQPSTLMRINFAATQDAGFWKKFAHARESMQRS